MPFCKITLHINGCAFKSKYIPMKWNISLKQGKENTNGIVTCSKTVGTKIYSYNAASRKMIDANTELIPFVKTVDAFVNFYLMMPAQ